VSDTEDQPYYYGSEGNCQLLAKYFWPLLAHNDLDSLDNGSLSKTILTLEDSLGLEPQHRIRDQQRN